MNRVSPTWMTSPVLRACSRTRTPLISVPVFWSIAMILYPAVVLMIWQWIGPSFPSWIWIMLLSPLPMVSDG
jgi:hypothetical protein